MGRKWEKKKRVVKFYCLYLLLFSIILILIFSIYKKRLDEEFEGMLENILTARTESHAAGVQGFLNDVQGTLHALSILIEMDDLDPSSELVQDYLKTLNEQEKNYHVEYLPIENLEKHPDDLDTLSENEKLVGRLKKGEIVTSDIICSERPEEGCYFVIAAPIQRGGKVIGILRDIIDADILVEIKQTNYLEEHLDSWIIEQDGSIVFSETDRTNNTDNFFERMEKEGTSREITEAYRQAIQTDTSVTFPVNIQKGEKSFVTLVNLKYNGWYTVTFSKEGETAVYADHIMEDTIFIGIILIVMTALIGFLVFQIVLWQQNSLTLEQQRYAALSRFSDTVLFEYNYKTDTLEFTSNAKKLFPLSELKIMKISSPDRHIRLIHREDLTKFIRQVIYPPKEGEIGNCEIRIQGLDGAYHWCSCQYQAVYDGKNKIPAILVGKIIDINEQKKKEAELLNRSSIDGLTGILNKKTVESRIKVALGKRRPGYLLMMDLDDFKGVNDVQGHSAGDKLLSEVGNILKNNFRKDDIVGRVGGDEFIAFVSTSEVEVVKSRADYLLEALKKLSEEKGYSVSASIGIARFPDHGKTYRELFAAADKAMYQAKKHGKNSKFCLTL